MVLGILADRKRMTRRMEERLPETGHVQPLTNGDWEWSRDGGFEQGVIRVSCPSGIPGDRLWVKENFRPTGIFAMYKPRDTKACGRFSYQADPVQLERDKTIKWRPSIFTPRWASRITLEITNVRLERLQDITEEDALAEGADIDRGSAYDLAGHQGVQAHTTARGCFETLWGSIYGPDSWRSNPWVWVIEFKKLTPGCPPKP